MTEGIFNKLINSIDNILSDEKEQKLKAKLSKAIRNSIFTDKIVEKLNENDVLGVIDEDDEEMKYFFSSIFPVSLKKDNTSFRLYKHKIEINMTDDITSRYIYVFSEGRLTSGMFKCFGLSDKEYFDIVNKIIGVIPCFKEAINNRVDNFIKYTELHKIHEKRVLDAKKREIIAEDNYNKLIKILQDSIKAGAQN